MLVAGGTSVARAALIYYTQAGVQGGTNTGLPPDSPDGGVGDPFANFWTQGETGAQASGSASTPTTYGVFSASASASVALGTDAGIRLQTRTVSGPTPGGPSGSDALAVAQWRDVLRVGSQATPPSQLRLTFEIEGAVTLELDPVSVGGIASAHAWLNPGGGLDLLSESPGILNGVQGAGVTFGRDAAEMDSDGTVHSHYVVGIHDTGTQNFSFSGTPTDGVLSGSVSWRQTLNVEYNPEYGGYVLNVLAGGHSFGTGGADTNGDFSHTIRLTAVTLADGSPLDAPVSFDSGFSLTSGATAVPEPSGLVLGAVSAVCAAAGLIHRRQGSRRRG
jgi:hypothetical protein